MKIGIKKLSVTLLSLTVLAGCGSNVGSTNFNDFQNSVAANSFNQNSILQFINEIENGEEVMIDEDFYKQYPDTFMANQAFNSIQNGVVPEYPETIAKTSDYNAQSFFSSFNKKAVIDVYDGFGNTSNFEVKGRLYKKKSIKKVNTGDSKWTNLFRNIKYFTPDPIKNETVNIMVNGITRAAKTDSKGFFTAKFDTGLRSGINQVTATLSSGKYKFEAPKEEIVADDINSTQISIVSDIDDTVKESGVDNKLKMFQKIFTGNYKTSKSIPGMATLYNGILRGQMSSQNGCCLHFVTGSPVHLYSRLQNFMKLNGFPQASADLKKLILFYKGSDPKDQVPYKVSRIRPMLQAFPNRKFVFFGDNTQKDPEVYKQMAKEFPNQVLGIYINNVVKDQQSNPRYNGMLLTNSTIDAAQDLLEKGVISLDILNRVVADVTGG